MSSAQSEIKRVTTQKLREMKSRGERISMLTNYIRSNDLPCSKCSTCH